MLFPRCTLLTLFRVSTPRYCSVVHDPKFVDKLAKRVLFIENLYVGNRVKYVFGSID